MHEECVMHYASKKDHTQNIYVTLKELQVVEGEEDLNNFYIIV